MSHVRGEESKVAKLTEDQARMVRRNVTRARKIMEQHSTKAYAERLGVSQSAIRRAVSGDNWAHVK